MNYIKQYPPGVFPPWLNTTLYSGKLIIGFMNSDDAMIYDRPVTFSELAKTDAGLLFWLDRTPICIIKIKIK